MEKLFFEFPTKKREKEAVEFIEEFIKYKSNINGTGGLDKMYHNYEKWLLKINNSLNKETVESENVTSSTFFVIREIDNKIIAMINIRHYLNDDLLKHGGHIGFGVRPTERKKGYATELLKYALIKLNELGIQNALLTCDKSNIGSAKTIKNNLGI